MLCQVAHDQHGLRRPAPVSRVGGARLEDRLNHPLLVGPSGARLVEATAATGRDCGALIVQMVIADETDAAAMAKWEHYKAGTDHEALAWRDAQAEDDPSEGSCACSGGAGAMPS